MKKKYSKISVSLLICLIIIITAVSCASDNSAIATTTPLSESTESVEIVVSEMTVHQHRLFNSDLVAA